MEYLFRPNRGATSRRMAMVSSKFLGRLRAAAKAVTQPAFRREAGAPAYFGNWVTLRESLEAGLDEAYRQYTAETSSPVAAISRELAAFLQLVCEHSRPQVVLDLGSGFSSYVLRRYQLSHEVDVYSVDDDPLWLDRTKAFLDSHNLPTGNLYLWDDLLRSDVRLQADLILYDLGDSKKRVRCFEHLLKFAAPKAQIIIDDVHKRNIREAAMDWIREHGFRYVDLAPYTKDSYRRFQWFITTPAA
jgi:predicted O-methyltransferase YrrM